VKKNMLEKMFDYIHTEKADINHIIKGRKSINIILHICGFFSILFLIFSLLFYTYDYYYSSIYYGVLAVIYLFLNGILIIKREIYSMMIFWRSKNYE